MIKHKVIRKYCGNVLKQDVEGGKAEANATLLPQAQRAWVRAEVRFFCRMVTSGADRRAMAAGHVGKGSTTCLLS